jgi:hypothetical protein
MLAFGTMTNLVAINSKRLACLTHHQYAGDIFKSVKQAQGICAPGFVLDCFNEGNDSPSLR